MTLDLIPDGSFVISKKSICFCYTISHLRYNRADNKCNKGRFAIQPLVVFNFPYMIALVLHTSAFTSPKSDSSLFQSNYIHAQQRLTNPRSYPLATKLELVFSKPAIGKYNVNSVDSSIDTKIGIIEEMSTIQLQKRLFSTPDGGIDLNDGSTIDAADLLVRDDSRAKGVNVIDANY